MATSAEDLEGTTPISEKERAELGETIATAIGTGYSVKLVGEPDQSASESDYAVAIIKKLAE